MIKEICANAVAGTKKVLDGLDFTAIEKIADRIINSDNTFVVADVGRPGLALMCLAQRLRQPTPSVHEGDVVLIGSVDGEDKTSITFMKKGKELHIDYDLFTMAKESTLQKDASEVVYFDCKAENGLIAEEYFELALYVVCDAIALKVQQKLGVSKERMQRELPNLY